MGSLELNNILTMLVSALREKLNLSVENAVAIVMLSSTAAGLQSGAIAERNIATLTNSILAEVNC